MLHFMYVSIHDVLTFDSIKPECKERLTYLLKKQKNESKA